MPELPEVETTLRGIKPHILNNTIGEVTIRHHRLRWPIPNNLPSLLKNNAIIQVERRAKYLILTLAGGKVLIHLGMSGRLRILTQPIASQQHDHLDIVFTNHKILRFTDPRRFGAILWTDEPLESHPLFKNLGPEPLEEIFSADYLWQRAQHKKTAIKSLLMDNKIVVGVGNIYAAESLFAAGIHPQTAAKDIPLARYKKLVAVVKTILHKAIERGGTTLKDFVDSNGKPGYFQLQLCVYGREGLRCISCKTILKKIQQGQRTTVFCGTCQT